MQIYSDKKAFAKRKRIFRIKIYFLLFFVVLIAFGIYYFLVFSSVFKIKSISIENNHFLTEEDILRDLKQIALSNSLGGQAGFDNMWSWPSGKIKVFNPAISELDINKNWLNQTIRIEVIERDRFAIWCVFNGSSCYWMDRQGVVFAQAPLTEGSLVYTIFDLRKNDLFLGSKVEEERFIDNLIIVLNNLNKTGFEAKKIIFNGELKEIRVETVEGPILLFSIRFNEAANISSIKDLNLITAEYIDLTVDNKIYYKNRK